MSSCHTAALGQCGACVLTCIDGRRCLPFSPKHAHDHHTHPLTHVDALTHSHSLSLTHSRSHTQATLHPSTAMATCASRTGARMSSSREGSGSPALLWKTQPWDTRRCVCWCDTHSGIPVRADPFPAFRQHVLSNVCSPHAAPQAHVTQQLDRLRAIRAVVRLTLAPSSSGSGLGLSAAQPDQCSHVQKPARRVCAVCAVRSRCSRLQSLPCRMSAGGSGRCWWWCPSRVQVRRCFEAASFG